MVDYDRGVLLGLYTESSSQTRSFYFLAVYSGTMSHTIRYAHVQRLAKKDGSATRKWLSPKEASDIMRQACSGPECSAKTWGFMNEGEPRPDSAVSAIASLAQGPQTPRDKTRRQLRNPSGV
jgi:hypothetical protein